MRINELMVQRTTAAGITLRLTGADLLHERMAVEVPRWKRTAGELTLKTD